MMQKFLNISKYVLVFSALLGIAGCGGSGDDATTGGLSKKAFIARAEAVCRKAEEEQFQKSSIYLKEHPGIKEEEVIIPAGLLPLEKELDALRGLGAPTGDEAEVNEYLEALAEGLKQAREDPGSALSQTENAFESANDRAKKYGFEICANNP
jgi:hypothetical protein